MRKNHFVDVYQYNPENIKEVIEKIRYNVNYIPARHKSWNNYSILINGKFCGININLIDVDEQGGRVSPRSLILKSIKNYINNETHDIKDYGNYSPNDEIKIRKEKIFQTIMIIKSFKKRDELSTYGLTNLYEIINSSRNSGSGKNDMG